jgi:hypothetical protein
MKQRKKIPTDYMALGIVSLPINQRRFIFCLMEERWLSEGIALVVGQRQPLTKVISNPNKTQKQIMKGSNYFQIIKLHSEQSSRILTGKVTMMGTE